jgi:hypothetical protein
MTAEELRGYVQAKPFHPFRVIIADGRSFEVPYKSSMKVGRREAWIFYVRPGDPPEAPYDQFQILGLDVIARVERLGPPVLAGAARPDAG